MDIALVSRVRDSLLRQDALGVLSEYSLVSFLSLVGKKRISTCGESIFDAAIKEVLDDIKIIYQGIHSTPLKPDGLGKCKHDLVNRYLIQCINDIADHAAEGDMELGP